MIIVLMGVTGCGKTTVGLELARRLGAPFLEGDTYHSEANRQKMSIGQPLTDADRLPWLASLHDAMARLARAGKPGVVACSALKRRYREILVGDLGETVRFVYLKLDRAEATARLQARTDHYMPASLVPSQFDALEAPGPDEALVLDARLPTESLVQQILDVLQPE